MSMKQLSTVLCAGALGLAAVAAPDPVAELQAKGKFYRVTAAGQREARPHDITITKEAPNYRA